MRFKCLSAVIVTGVVASLMLVGHIAGTAAPQADKDEKIKQSFESLRMKLPALVETWAKSWEMVDWVEPKKVKTEIALARFTGPAEAKITILVKMSFEEIQEVFGDIPLYFTFYLHYFDGKWTIVGTNCPGKAGELAPPLILAIDRAGAE